MNAAIIMYAKDIKGGGGAERRFARAWRYMAAHESVLLIVNKDLANDLRLIGAIDDKHTQKLIEIEDCNPISYCFKILRVISSKRIRLIHFPLPQFKLLPLYLIIPKRISFIHTIALSAFAHNTRTSLSTSALSKYLWSRANALDALYASFLDNCSPAIRGKVSVTPCSFTDYTKFKPNKDKKNYIVFSGRLIDEKNPLLFVQALRQLYLDGYHDWVAYVAGDGPLKESLEKSISEYGLTDHIVIGRQPDIAALLSESKIFISIQKTENYPSQALLEAMASENFIIASNVGETSRLIIDGTTGVLIDPSPSTLAREIQQALSNEPYRKKIAENGSKLVREKHTIDVFAKYLLNMWTKAI